MLGCIAIACVYLLVHAREPLRLNLGDPGSDARLALRLGVTHIAAIRLVAVLISGLALWLLFSYVRRLYADRVAWIATALFGTSLLWLMYADSLHEGAVLPCMGFLSLWGLARAIESRQRRYYAAAFAGAFGCFFTSFDYAVFLPAAALFTIYVKAGSPLGRGHWQLVALCALGWLLGIALGWHGLDALPASDRASWLAMPTMIRRVTLLFTPLVWIPIVIHVVQAVRAPTVAAAIKDSAAWMLVAALATFYLFAQRAAVQMLAAQALLPFYAIGSARLLDRMLAGRPLLRQLASAWLVIAPLWSFYLLFTHPRSVLHRDDLATTHGFLAAHDRNDFVLSNLAFDDVIDAAFQRHRWPMFDAKNPSAAPIHLLRMFERTGAAYAHAIIFRGPDARFVDQSLWPIASPRGLWAITGAPYLHRAKAKAVIAEYDTRVLNNLKAVHATKVLQLSNYTVYRIDRMTVLAILAKEVAPAPRVDFGSVNAWPHELLGWSGPLLLPDGTPASVVETTERCPAAPCKTHMAARGLGVTGEVTPQLGQIMLRIDPVCDLQLRFRFAGASYARSSIHGWSSGPLIGDRATFTVPRAHLHRGVNVVTLENLFPTAAGVRLRVTSLDLAPACAGGD